MEKPLWDCKSWAKRMGHWLWFFCFLSRFSVRFKESNVAVKVVQGSGSGGKSKLICKKKGNHCLEVTVQ